MAKTNERFRLEGHRTSMYHLEHKFPVHGWIIHDAHDSLRIEGQSDHPVQRGDRFLLEVFSIGRRIRILATMTYAHIPERGKATFELRQDAWLDSLPTDGTERLRVSGLTATLANHFGVLETDCLLLDVSLRGVSLQTAEQHEMGELLQMIAELPNAHFESVVAVRNCVPVSVGGFVTSYRTGLSLENMDRVTQARWKTLLSNGFSEAA